MEISRELNRGGWGSQRGSWEKISRDFVKEERRIKEKRCGSLARFLPGNESGDIAMFEGTVAGGAWREDTPPTPPPASWRKSREKWERERRERAGRDGKRSAGDGYVGGAEPRRPPISLINAQWAAQSALGSEVPPFLCPSTPVTAGSALLIFRSAGSVTQLPVRGHRFRSAALFPLGAAVRSGSCSPLPVSAA